MSQNRRPRRRTKSGPSVAGLLQDIQARGEEPFLLAVDELHYGRNLGTLLRVAAAGGAHALVLPPARSHPGLTPEVRALAGPAATRIPIIREGLMSALTTLRRAGVLVVAAAEDGDARFGELPLTGATAIVLGGEDKGVSASVRKKCDAVVSLPMMGKVPSLNVAATATVLVYERLRQQQVEGS